MKRAGHLIDQITAPDNLRLAWQKAIRGKRERPAVITFAKSFDRNIQQLGTDLKQGNFQWGPYGSFLIYDPKERLISVSPIRDRIASHAIFNICGPIFDRFQIDQSYACRQGKGQYAALDQAGIYAKKNEWYLKLDIRKYFDSIDHAILKTQIHRLFKDPTVLELLENLTDSFHYQTGRGIPIGNLSSQYFANHYLGILDYYIKEELHCRCYVRYMDDFVLWSRSRSELVQWWDKLEEFISSRLSLEVKPCGLNRMEKGLSFLGYRLWPGRRRLASRSRLRFRRKYRELMRRFRFGLYTEEELAIRLTSLFSFICHAETKEYRRRILNEE